MAVANQALPLEQRVAQTCSGDLMKIAVRAYGLGPRFDSDNSANFVWLRGFQSHHLAESTSA